MLNVDKLEEREEMERVARARKERAQELWAKARKFVFRLGGKGEADARDTALDFTKPKFRDAARKIDKDIRNQLLAERKTDAILESCLEKQLRDQRNFSSKRHKPKGTR